MARFGPVFHELAQQKGCTIVEGHMVSDHLHMLIKIPPKHAVSSRVYQGQACHLSSPSRSKAQRQWRVVLGYAVSTVGMKEAQVRTYIREQEDRTYAK